MATFSSGFQTATNAFDFINLTVPLSFPALISTDPRANTHLPVPPAAMAPQVPGYSDLMAERTGSDFGQPLNFKIMNNDNDIYENVTLVLNLSALHIGATNPTNACMPRYVDDIGCAAIDYMEFTYGGNQLQKIYGDEMHFRMVQETEHDELTRKYQLQAAGLSDMERAVLAQNSQWVYVDLPFWFTKDAASSWHQYAFQRVTRINIYLRPSAYLIQQSMIDPLGAAPSTPYPVLGTTAPFLLNYWLRFTISCPTLETKKVYQGLVDAMGNVGWNMLFPDMQRITQLDIPVNTTNWTNQLTTFTKFAYNLRFWLRPRVNLIPDFTNNRRWQLMSVDGLSFDMTGKRYLQPTDDFYLKNAMIGKYFKGNEQYPIYYIPFTDYPTEYANGFGGMEFSQVVNPAINLSFTAATTTECFADFYLCCQNYIKLLTSNGASGAATVQPIQ
jgi:hypothetical protein